ncbi:MAG TPA: hypothetical protein VHJ79_23090, partial [Mycobacterium sp.]|nr:hypothetical protein [Mycobacterium sp.]
MAALAAGTVTVALIMPTPAAAAPDPSAPTVAASDAGQISSAVMKALQRDLKLSAGEAHARLAREATAASTEAALRRSLGAAFA